MRGSKIIGIGRNYPNYTKNEGKQAGQVPAGFIKVPSCIVGPGRDILKPHATRQLDCETELAVVIGKQCKNVAEANAYDVIAGYTILNDVTARDVGNLERQAGHMLLGKTFDTFAPMGPWLVTKVEIHDPMNLRIRTRVNGELRQDGNTAEMIHSIPKLVSYLSQMTLMPGDIISTGSPGGGASGASRLVPQRGRRDRMRNRENRHADQRGGGRARDLVACRPNEEENMLIRALLVAARICVLALRPARCARPCA